MSGIVYGICPAHGIVASWAHIQFVPRLLPPCHLVSRHGIHCGLSLTLAV